jgi:hypothetical protein
MIQVQTSPQFTASQALLEKETHLEEKTANLYQILLENCADMYTTED